MKIKKKCEEKVYIKDIALMVYYFIFGTLILVTLSQNNLQIFTAGLFIFGIVVLSIFIKYNLDFSIKNIKKVWKKDKRQFKIRRLSDKELRREYVGELYYKVLQLYLINIFILLIIDYFVNYYEIYYLWLLYIPCLIFSIYLYKRIKKWIYLNEHKRKDT